MATVRNHEAMLFGQSGILHVTTAFGEGFFRFLVVNVRDTFIVKDGGDIVFEIILAHRASQNVTGLKKEIVQILHTFQLQLLLRLRSVK